MVDLIFTMVSGTTQVVGPVAADAIPEYTGWACPRAMQALPYLCFRLRSSVYRPGLLQPLLRQLVGFFLVASLTLLPLPKRYDMLR